MKHRFDPPPHNVVQKPHTLPDVTDQAVRRSQKIKTPMASPNKNVGQSTKTAKQNTPAKANR